MEKKNIRKQIAHTIKQARRNRRLTQQELANRIGVSQSRFSDIENGKITLSAEQFVQLATYLNIPLDEFAKGSTDEAKQLQNALARHGGSKLRETEVLPSSEFGKVDDVILKTLLNALNARHIVSLAPVTINNIEQINLKSLENRLYTMGLQNRWLWLIASILSAVRSRLNEYVPRRIRLKYKRVELILSNYLSYPELLHRVTASSPDMLDRTIVSHKSFALINRSRDELASKWNIVTRINNNDFISALKDYESNY